MLLRYVIVNVLAMNIYLYLSGRRRLPLHESSFEEFFADILDGPGNEWQALFMRQVYNSSQIHND